MIDSEKIEQKLKPLNDRIETINLKLGSELANELLSRIEITISSFFEEFKSLSSKSFELYWAQQEKNKDSRLLEDLVDREEDSKAEAVSVNVPKFISDYSKKNDKK